MAKKAKESKFERKIGAMAELMAMAVKEGIITTPQAYRMAVIEGEKIKAESVRPKARKKVRK